MKEVAKSEDDGYIQNKWQIQIKTSLFYGFETTPVVENISLPQVVVETIERLIVHAVNCTLAQDDAVEVGYNNDGIQALELYVNGILSKVVHGARIRADLYPDPVGLCVVINVKYREADLDNVKCIDASNYLEDLR